MPSDDAFLRQLQLEQVLRPLRQRYVNGESPAALLHFLHSLHSDWGAGDFVGVFADAFLLGSEISCIGGWRYDGSGEISDSSLNFFLTPAIEETRPQWEALLGRHDEEASGV